MAFNETFDSGLGSWAIVGPFGGAADNGAWTSAAGNSAAGCVLLEYGSENDGSLVNGGALNPTGDTHPIVSGDYFYLNYNVFSIDPAATRWIDCYLTTVGPSGLIQASIYAGGSGWQQFAFDLAAYAGRTITAISIGIANYGGTGAAAAYVDSITIGNTPPALGTASAPSQLRLLGIAADSNRIFLTGIASGTIRHFAMTHAGVQVGNSSAFGTAGYTDPDTFSRGLLPQIKVDGQLHLYGRDGANRQILYNDLNGSAGWVDVGAGTATWGTAKYCVALMPSALDPTVMSAAFYDNDVYTGDHVAPGSVVWEKEGDAPTNLRCGAKHPIEPKILFLAGTAAGTIFQTVNAGFGTYTQIGGTVVTGTINAIEVSR